MPAAQRLSGHQCSPTASAAARNATASAAGSPASALVLGGIASANRDATPFAAPDRLDLARTPNRHLTFDAGGHYCLGAPLARLEGRVAFAALVERLPRLPRLPRLRLADPAAPPAWRRGVVLRGLRTLPVTAS